MIYDCFMYFGEDELLEIRMEELWDLVDKFVITEATTTFTKQPKVMYYKGNKDKFEKYKDKIIYIEADLQNISGSTVAFEQAQRDYFMESLDFNDSDIFIVGDVDEIPKVETLKNVLSKIEERNFCTLLQSFHYYYVNFTSIGREWRGSIVTLAQNFKIGSPSMLRDKRGRSVKLWREHNGGWHFSYLGGPEKVLEKMKAAFIPCDTQRIRPNCYSIQYITQIIEERRDLFRRGQKTFTVDNTLELPKYLVENKEKFSHLFYKGDI